MTDNEIMEMFNGRWRIYGIKDLENCEVTKLTGKEIKQKCFEFFKAGFLLGSSEEETITDVDFEEWWKLYNRKVDKANCLKKWKKMSKKDRRACMEATPAYVAATEREGRKWRKHPLTFLNRKSWLDEIITDTTPTQQQLQQQRIDAAARLISGYAKESK